MAPKVFVDANVLFSKTLCDWLFLLRIETGGGLFVLMSSQDSVTEALYHLRKNHPTRDGSFTAQRRKLIERSLDDLLDNFSGEVDFPGEDIGDHHIHAAAVECGAKYLITDDQGWNGLEVDDLPYEVHSSDSFLMLVAANAPHAVDRVILRQLDYLKRVNSSISLPEALKDAGCPNFAECVQKHVEHLAHGDSPHGIARKLSLGASGRGTPTAEPDSQ